MEEKNASSSNSASDEVFIGYLCESCEETSYFKAPYIPKFCARCGKLLRCGIGIESELLSA